MNNQCLHGNILTPQGWVHGDLHFNARLLGVSGAPADPAHNDAPCILPGFIDLHVHGGGGRDVMQGGDAARTIARTHTRHGTTSWLATTMTAPPEEIEQALTAVGEAAHARRPGTARLLGVHLEGPYLNAGKLGAQPDCAQTGTLAQVQRWNALAPIKVVTLAPEVPGHLALVSALCQLGMRVQMGHTLGSYEDGVAALAQGASSFTHLFNAMSGLHHREPGMVGAALAHAQFAELIPDLLHVHPGAIQVALRAIPQLYCVTDATAATGMPDGAYLLGRLSVQHCAGAVRLPDGQLAGSALTLDQAWRNLLAIGLHPLDAVRRLSTLPADAVGESRLGRLAIGAHADFVVMDAQWQLQSAWIGGQPVHHSQA